LVWERKFKVYLGLSLTVSFPLIYSLKENLYFLMKKWYSEKQPSAERQAAVGGK
jgi:hypothetical protein